MSEGPYWTSDVPNLILRLLVAAVLASIFGWEREIKNRAAGLRTHILVCMGATLLTLISQSYVESGLKPVPDPTRITAQIVSGIGFLGAGTILVRGSLVRGLTTAASLWIAAAIGIAVGRGGEFLVVAAAASFLTLIVLTLVDRLEDWLLVRRKWREVTVKYVAEEEAEHRLTRLFQEMQVHIRRFERVDTLSPGHRIAVIEIRLPPNLSSQEVNDRLLQGDWIQSVEWDH